MITTRFNSPAFLAGLKHHAAICMTLFLITACHSEREDTTVAPKPQVTDNNEALSCPETPPVVKTNTITIEKPCACECNKPPKSAPPKPIPAQTQPTNLHRGTDFSLLTPSSWQSVQWLQKQNLVESWPAWLQSCQKLQFDPKWKNVCEAAQTLDQNYAGQVHNGLIQRYFTNHFNLHQVHNTDGSTTGLVTGYYQPVLKGSRTQSATYRYPLYHTPDNLISVSLASQFPELKHKRVRGMLNQQELVPYLTRGDIDSPEEPLKDYAFLYLEDSIETFFLHVQGSGVISLDTGEVIQVGYDNHNGHPYQSIGKALIDRGELTPSQASMAGIKGWAQLHPGQVQSLLNVNPSYVFFRELPHGLPGPLGALGVPLLAEQAIAVDKRYIPLGAPVFLSTTYPNSPQPLRKLMMAQDTGGAIQGAVRADFYWGAGEKAGAQAGAMKQKGFMWVLLPKTFEMH